MALCPYFGECGGCSSQDVEYEKQLDSKLDKFSRSIEYSKDQIKVFSDKPFNYRNRMDFIFNHKGLGLRQRGNWKNIIDIEKCPISEDKINVLLKEVRDYFKNPDFFNIHKNAGTFKYAVIRTAEKSSISFVLNEDSMNTGDAINKIKLFAKITTADNVIVTYVAKQTDSSISEEFFVVKGSDQLSNTLLDKQFDYSVQGFFQNNTAMAEKMHEYVNELIRKHEHTAQMTLLDLYAGVGTFGINNSGLFKNVIIVESDKHCMESAKENIKKNKLANAEAILTDAASLKKVNIPENTFVITDPPRSGMHPKTIEELKKKRPQHIIYISCNIEQLGKDIKKFSQYKLKSAAMFDLFPQTPHIEGIVELEL